MPTDRAPRSRRGFGATAALIVIGAGLVAIGVSASSLVTYRAGAIVLAVGIGLLIAWTVRGRAVLRGAAGAAVAVLALVVTVIAPRVIYGDPDGLSAWRDESGGYGQMLLLGDSVLGQGPDGVRSLDLGSGRTHYTIATGDDTIWAASDGSVAGIEGGTVTYYGDDGRKRWSTKVDTDKVNGIAAIADDRVVAVTCAGDAGCRLIGLDTRGTIAWRAPTSVVPTLTWVQQRRGPQDSEFTSVHYVAPVAVASAGTSTTVRDVRGQIVGRYSGSLFAQRGELIVTRDGCTLRGWQAGSQRWQRAIACDTPGSGQLVTRDHLFIAPNRSTTVSVRLSDGRSHEFGALRLNTYGTGKDSQVGVAGDDVIVQRDSRHLTGRDATTGAQLWTYDVPGSGTPGVSVENGAVTIYGRPDERRSAFTGHADANFEVTVLDARTGRRTGGLLLSRTVTDSYGVAPGLSVVVAADTRAIGRRHR